MNKYIGFALSGSRFAYIGFALSGSRFAYIGFALSGSRLAYIGISLSPWLLASNAFAQDARGVVTGVVTDPGGNAVEGATVNAKNVATGAIVNAVSSANGRFMISGLPAGTYDLATPDLC